MVVLTLAFFLALKAPGIEVAACEAMERMAV
jgi:hypothetical protein